MKFLWSVKKQHCLMIQLKIILNMEEKNSTDEEVFEAAKLSYCDEFISNLPNKYETLIGENGVRLVWWRKTKTFYCKSNDEKKFNNFAG